MVVCQRFLCLDKDAFSDRLACIQVFDTHISLWVLIIFGKTLGPKIKVFISDSYACLKFQKLLAESQIYMATHLGPCYAGTRCAVVFSEWKDNAVMKQKRKNPNTTVEKHGFKDLAQL